MDKALGIDRDVLGEPVFLHRIGQQHLVIGKLYDQALTTGPVKPSAPADDSPPKDKDSNGKGTPPGNGKAKPGPKGSDAKGSGAKPGDSISLKFARLSATNAGMAVFYGVGAADQKSPTPWGDQVAFAAGWKPIGFAGSCWRLIVDGADTGLVLAVGP